MRNMLKSKDILLITLLISAILVINTNAASSSSSTNSTSSTSSNDSTKREDDGDDDDSSSSDSRPSPIHSAFAPMASPYPMFPRMPFPGMPPMNPYMYRPVPPPMSAMSAHPMAASMMRPVMSPYPGGHASQPLFAPMNPIAHPMSMASYPAMRRAWEAPQHPSLTGHNLLEQLLHSESHADPLTESFGTLGGLPIEQMDEEEFYEKLRQHQRQKERQVASRREFQEPERDSYSRDNYRRRPYTRSQIPPPPSPTYSSYDDRHRDNGHYDNNHRDPYEPMQEENRYDRGRHDHRDGNNYVGRDQRDPMEYDDRPPVDGPPPPMRDSRPQGPPGEDRPPYVRRSIHDERSPDYPNFDDKA